MEAPIMGNLAYMKSSSRKVIKQVEIKAE